jgi:3-dehydroquinate synthase
LAELVNRYPARGFFSRVRIGRRALDRIGGRVRDAMGIRRVAIVTDALVGALHCSRVARSLQDAGIAVEMMAVPRGERAKHPTVALRLWNRFAALGLTRRDAIVALGGGSIGDLAGFAAATWLRGVPWIGVPTTLLAQVDSSIGGKTGIDLAAGKNLVGAFHQPALVVADPDVLATLTPRQRRSGLAEVVKMGFAIDATLFRWAERHADRLANGDPRALEHVVRASIAAKARIVRRDEREREGGPRTALNFGHTLGHAIEAALGYRRVTHGEAVAIGMRAAARLSVEVAGLDDDDRARLEALLDRLKLPRRMPAVSVARLEAAMRLDKKRAREVRWVLTPRIGHASVPRPIDRRRVRAAMLEVGARR